MGNKDTPAQKDQRKNPRSELQVWAVEKAGNSTSFHLVKNLSLDGFFIEKQLPFSIGSMVHLELELGHEKVPIKGEVIDNYRDPAANYFGAGVRFVDMDKDVLKKIELYLKDIQKASKSK